MGMTQNLLELAQKLSTTYAHDQYTVTEELVCQAYDRGWIPANVRPAKAEFTDEQAQVLTDAYNAVWAQHRTSGR